MYFMKVLCGSCGNVFSVPDDQEIIFCSKCGTNIPNEENNCIVADSMLEEEILDVGVDSVEEEPEKNNVEKPTENTAQDKSKKKENMLFNLAIISVILVTILIGLYPTVLKPMKYYKDAENYAMNGEYEAAINLLKHIDTKHGYEMIEDYLSDMVNEGQYNNVYTYLTNSLGSTIDDNDMAVRASISKKLDHAGQHSIALKVLKQLDTDIAKAEMYSLANEYELQKDYNFAAIYYGAAGDYIDSRDKSFALWDKVSEKTTVDAGSNHTVALTTSGTVLATGDNSFRQCNVSDWTDIVSVAAGDNHTVGLKSDGTVVAIGNNESEQCDVEKWTDIVAIDAGGNITVGLKSDGTIVYCGSTALMSDLYIMDFVVDFSVGKDTVIFSKADNSIVGVSGNILAYCGEADVEEWTDIKDVSVGYQHSIGLKNDGTLIATEFKNRYEGWVKYYNQCEVDGVGNVVAISAGRYHTAVVFSNGKAGAVGLNSKGQCEVSGLSNLIDVSAGNSHTVYLRKDGTLVAVGDNTYGQCDVSNMKNIKLP